MDEDVLSLSAHEEWESAEVTEASVEELEEYVVLDELEEDLVDEHIVSSGALGPAEETVPVWAEEMVVPVEEHTRRGKECPVCSSSSCGRVRRHVLRTHLPWFWAGTTACWQCEVQEAQASTLAVRHTEEHQMGSVFNEENLHQWCQLINGCLHLLCSWFECDGLEGLLQYVIGRRLFVGIRSTFSEQETQLLTFYATNYSPEDNYNLCVNPPNHVVCLTNWEIMATLLRRLGPAYQETFLNHRECLTYEGNAIAGPVDKPYEPFLFVDSHFHLDLILQRMRYRNFLHLESIVSPHSDPGFYYGVANYVFPNQWNKWAAQVGAASRVYVSFGIHPHVAAAGVSSAQMGDLQVLTCNYRCVALGETGFDFTTRCSCVKCRTPEACRLRMTTNQKEVFVETLQLARTRSLPVIIHCRDHGDGSAAASALTVIQDGFSDLQYHRHCFMGGLEELLAWQSLPHVVFGVTGAFMRCHPNSQTIIPRIPAHQLVFESHSCRLFPAAPLTILGTCGMSPRKLAGYATCPCPSYCGLPTATRCNFTKFRSRMSTNT